jgi:hypothetical protein
MQKIEHWHPSFCIWHFVFIHEAANSLGGRRRL